MNLQVNVTTLGVKDPERSKQFYKGLGCAVEQDHGDYVSLLMGNESPSLALYSWDALADDAGVASEGTGFRGFTLSAIFDSAADVDALLTAAREEGGEVVKPSRNALWGGYSGYFADPDGHLWKVASTSRAPLGSRQRRARALALAGRPAPMSPTESVVTLGVSDIKRAKHFYGEDLGCQIQKDYSKFVSFSLGEGSSSLALYQWDALANDAGVPPVGHGFRGFTLSLIVESADRVDALLTGADRAGGAVAVPGHPAQWGGHSGYFSDPDGYLWKVASAS